MSYFFCCCEESNLREEFCVGSQSELHSHGREAMVVGAGGNWSHGIHSQETVMDAGARLAFSFLFCPRFLKE